MLRANRTLILLVLLALLLSACQPLTRPAAQEPPTPRGLRFDAPEYAVDGPYAVGVRYFTIPAKTEQDRELTATVWYPAQIPDPTAAKMVYEQKFAPGEVPAISVFGNAALDAPPDAGGAPYPLVVYTHAHWSFGQELPYLAEHLASRGFVLISVDHEDNWSTAFGPMAYQAMIRRPQEVTREIDFAAGLATPEASLSGMIDTIKVGVTGWSMGGETSLAVAGARWDLNNARTWCAENPDGAELNTWVCSDMLDHEAEMAAFAGLDETPQGLWPSRLDPRIRAAVSLAGPTITFGSDGMKSVDVPVMFMVGSGETAVDPAFEMAAPYESISAERKAKVVLDHGEHLLFFSSCADTPSTAALGFSTFCTDPVWDMDRAHDLVNHFATAFFLAELKGDAAAAAALAPANVSFPGVEYAATGYDAAAAPEPALDAAIAAKIDGIVQKAMADNPVPGFEMCVVKDGQILYSKAFGVADVAEGRPMSTQSALIQGSISKSLTAMATMKLAEQGKIDLDAPVTTYLPYFSMADERYKGITVRMLLGHRGGLPDSPLYWQEPLDPALNPLEQAVRDLGDMRLLFAPGEDWSYSSYGYLTLGAIIATVTGKPYETYMQEEWLAPLGMTHSTFVPEDVEPALRAAVYKSDDQGKAVATEPNCDGRDAPACTLSTSCEDMARWAQLMLNKGKLDGAALLQPESIDAMWTPLSSTPWLEALGSWYGPPFAGYGLGWYVGEMEGHRLVGHAGAINGANAQIQLAPYDNLVVIAMDNWLDLESATGYPASFAAVDVLYLLLGIEPQ